ncbi:MAG: polysaccharide deacetylase family protein, partial [Candidatus Eremiobacteraeota bacterium]|nr:polysaccharide deacetylase family protein [Candidatus Eremiobacteraeota bacterium]
MSSRRNALLAIVVVAIGYVLYRLFVHSNALLTPTLVSPSMDAHRALSPDIVARVDRLLHEREGVRIDRPRLIALTFDDGPYPVTTPLLLDVLRSERVSATFFLIGRDAETYPELTQRIEQDGHEIANHTFSHPNLDELPPDAVRRELLEGAATLDRYVSDPGISTLFRPPHGRYTEDTVRIAQGLGYDTVLWTDDPGDWRSVTPDVLADHVF